MHDFPVCLFNPAFRGCQNPINGLLNCYDWKLRDRSVWAEFLTDDPAAWKVRVGEHFMFRDDATQLDVNIERILFHPARNRQYTHARRLLIYLLTCSPPPPPQKKIMKTGKNETGSKLREQPFAEEFSEMGVG